MNITILGAGSWGTAIAKLLSTNGNKVTVWSIDPAEVAMPGVRHTPRDRITPTHCATR